jgi:hypothetical protein
MPTWDRAGQPCLPRAEPTDPAGPEWQAVRMPLDPYDLPEQVLTFLTERHLATLTTQRRDGSPHVVPVGFTFDGSAALVRVIASDGSVKVRNADRPGPGRPTRPGSSVPARGPALADARGTLPDQSGPGGRQRRRTAVCPALPGSAGESATGRAADRRRPGPGAGLRNPADRRPINTSTDQSEHFQRTANQAVRASRAPIQRQ